MSLIQKAIFLLFMIFLLFIFSGYVTRTDYKSLSAHFGYNGNDVTIEVCNTSSRIAEYYDTLFLYSGPYIDTHPFFGFMIHTELKNDGPQNAWYEYEYENVAGVKSIVHEDFVRPNMSMLVAIPVTRYMWPGSCIQAAYKVKRKITIYSKFRKQVDTFSVSRVRVKIKIFKDKIHYDGHMKDESNIGALESREFTSEWFEVQ